MRTTFLSIFALIIFAIVQPASADPNAEFLKLVRTAGQVGVTMRDLVAVGIQSATKDEIDGVMNFARKLKIDLDRPMAFKVVGGQAYLGTLKMSLDVPRDIVRFDGYAVQSHPGERLDQVIERANDELLKLKRRRAGLNFVLPNAYADGLSDRIGGAAILQGFMLTLAGARAFQLAVMDYSNVSRFGSLVLMAGGVAVATAGLFILASTRKSYSGEMPQVHEAHCDGTGLHVTLQKGMKLDVSLNNETNKTSRKLVDRNGSKVDSAIEDPLGAPIEAAAREFLHDCMLHPMGNKELTPVLANALRRHYQAEPAPVTKPDAPSKASKPPATV